MNTPPDAVDAFIASLTGSYVQPAFAEPQRLVQVQRKVKAPSKLAAVKAAKASEVQPTTEGLHVKPLVTSLPLPAKGSLTAREYLIAMRRSANRDDRIVAIAGYLGFDRHQSYSSQELAANLSANRALRPMPCHPKVPGAAVSLAGFVAGMPDPVGKKLADLKGREVLATEEYLVYTKQATEALALGDTVKASEYALMAQAETERLAQIKRDIASF